MSHTSLVSAWNATQVFGLKDVSIAFGEILMLKSLRQSTNESKDVNNQNLISKIYRLVACECIESKIGMLLA